jgi:hypothetical protein
MLIVLIPLRYWRSFQSESADSAKNVPPAEAVTAGS